MSWHIVANIVNERQRGSGRGGPEADGEDHPLGRRHQDGLAGGYCRVTNSLILPKSPRPKNATTTANLEQGEHILSQSETELRRAPNDFFLYSQHSRPSALSYSDSTVLQSHRE